MEKACRQIIIVGGVACGPKAAARARRCDPSAEITIIERGEYLSYAGCGLPYFVGGTVKIMDGLRTVPFGLVRDEAFFENVKGIHARTRTLAESIDRDAKTLAVRNLNSGETETLAYDKLVLATGGSPTKPPIDGLDLDGVFTLHTPPDALQLKEWIESREPERAVIVGAGLIGLEVVESLFNQAVDVTVLEMAEQVLPSVLDRDMAFLLQKDLARDGVEIATSQRVLRLEGEGSVKKVITSEREIEADMVIVATGIRPNVELAKNAGLDIGETGAIAVNELMQTSDPDIFAGGDCVECHDIVSGQKLFAPLGSTANRHGRVIGDNVTAGRDVFPGIVGTMVFKSMNMNIAKTGLTETRARELGYDAVTSITPCQNRVHFFPGNQDFLLKLVAERESQRLLGGQLVGPGDVTKRVDILATALRFGATLPDVANLDLGYSPPFSMAMDGVIHAANTTRNQIDGAIRVVNPDALRERLAQEEPLVLLDVREAGEVAKMPVGDERITHIPLSELRSRTGELPKDTEIVCLCAKGTRAYEAGLTVLGAGFSNVAFLDGGIRIWSYVCAPGKDG